MYRTAKVKLIFILLVIINFFLSRCGIENSVDEQNKIRQQFLSHQIGLLNNAVTHHFSHQDSYLSSFSDSSLNYLLGSFYTHREYSLVWYNGFQLKEETMQLDSLLRSAHLFGLDSSFYSIKKLKKIINTPFLNAPDSSEAIEIVKNDFAITTMLFQFIADLKFGTLDPTSYERTIKYDSLGDLEFQNINFAISDSLDFKEYILRNQPQNREYNYLINAWQYYLKNYSTGDTTLVIPSSKADSSKSYLTTKTILYKYGYLDSLTVSDSVFLDQLKNYQIQHGLTGDAKIGKNTIYALSKKNTDRYWQALASIEKLKWEHDYGDEYIYVNIPNYFMKVVINDSTIKNYKVVNGTRKKSTPILTSSLEHFTINPYWHVPKSITNEELLPKMRKDSTFLARNKYQIFRSGKVVKMTSIDWKNLKEETVDFKIRQDGGSYNALGLVKFIFPNNYQVYIHDTPSKRHFERDIRAYSHGCIRLQEPFDFANYLLEREKLSDKTLDQLVKSGKRKKINLEKSIPVYLRYVTAEGDKDNNIFFYKDIYGRDKQLLKAMKKTFF